MGGCKFVLHILEIGYNEFCDVMKLMIDIFFGVLCGCEVKIPISNSCDSDLNYLCGLRTRIGNHMNDIMPTEWRTACPE